MNETMEYTVSIYQAEEGGFWAEVPSLPGCCEYLFTPSPGTDELSLNPLFSSDIYYTLQENSPLIDAGNPNVVYNDLDGSRNDMGIYGGQNKMPSPPTAGSISGFKINDTNGNGRWDAGEVGIEEWHIRLIGITGTGNDRHRKRYKSY